MFTVYDGKTLVVDENGKKAEFESREQAGKFMEAWATQHDELELEIKEIPCPPLEVGGRYRTTANDIIRILYLTPDRNGRNYFSRWVKLIKDGAIGIPETNILLCTLEPYIAERMEDQPTVEITSIAHVLGYLTGNMAFAIEQLSKADYPNSAQNGLNLANISKSSTVALKAALNYIEQEYSRNLLALEIEYVPNHPLVGRIESLVPRYSDNVRQALICCWRVGLRSEYGEARLQLLSAAKQAIANELTEHEIPLAKLTEDVTIAADPETETESENIKPKKKKSKNLPN